MDNTIQRFVGKLRAILGDELCSIVLYGSYAMGDFRLGWSDLDILCLTFHSLPRETSERLVNIRQAPDERLFEGVVASVKEYQTQQFSGIVYWGTSGQRITSDYKTDVFSRYEIARYSKLLYGADISGKFIVPTYEELKDGVRRHYEAIRKYAGTTGESLYSCGWLFDIARCLYTLQYGDIISKTKAGEWALENHLCPEEDQLIRALKVRTNPRAFAHDPETKRWLGGLSPTIQRFADVLEERLRK